MDILKRPEWHTTQDSEITNLRQALAGAELRAIKAAQAEDVAQFSFETAKRRADRAEEQVRALLVAFAVDPDGDLPPGVADEVAESIRQDLDGGLAVDEVPEQARRLVSGWQEETR